MSTYPVLPPLHGDCKWEENPMFKKPEDTCGVKVIPNLGIDFGWKKMDDKGEQESWILYYKRGKNHDEFTVDGVKYIGDGRIYVDNLSAVIRRVDPWTVPTYSILPLLPDGAKWVFDTANSVPIIEKESYTKPLYCVKAPTLPADFIWYEYTMNNIPVIVAKSTTGNDYEDNEYITISETVGADTFKILRLKNHPPAFVECPPIPKPTKPVLTNLVTAYRTTDKGIEDLYANGYITQDGLQSIERNVLKYYKLPYKIPINEYEQTQEHIMYGNIESTTGGNKIITSEIKIDLGTIIIDGKYGNVYDYINAKAKLFIPNCKEIELDVVDIMDKMVDIEIYIDPLTGSSILVLRDDLTKDLILTEKVDFIKEIPIKVAQMEEIRGALTDVNYYNGILKPTIVITRKIPAGNIDCYNENFYECGALSNLTGFIKLIDVKLNVEALETEKDEIRRLLLQGVYLDD